MNRRRAPIALSASLVPLRVGALMLAVGLFAGPSVAAEEDSDISPRDDVEIQTEFNDAVRTQRRRVFHVLLGHATFGLAVGSGAALTSGLVVADTAGTFPFGEIQMLGLGAAVGTLGAVSATVLVLDAVMSLGGTGKSLLPIDRLGTDPVATMADADALEPQVDDALTQRLYVAAGLLGSGLLAGAISAAAFSVILGPRLFGAAGSATDATSLERLGLSVGALGLGAGAAAISLGCFVPWLASDAEIEMRLRNLGNDALDDDGDGPSDGE